MRTPKWRVVPEVIARPFAMSADRPYCDRPGAPATVARGGAFAMADIPITLTCADYARLAPLMTGDVKPDGIDLTLVHGTGGWWTARAEMLQRALQDPAVDGGEASMAGHL